MIYTAMIGPIAPRWTDPKLNPSNRYIWFHRRKFGSQTSDNMDRWKSEGGKSQRREEQKREDQRRERVRRKKIQVREKVGKSRTTAFFPMICGSRGAKSRLAEAAGAESMWPRWEMNNCTPFWHEAYLEIKMHKTHNFRNHFWKLKRWTSARRCGAKHKSKAKCTKHTRVGAFF